MKIIRFIAFVTFPLFCGIFLVADDAVILFLTEKMASNYNSFEGAVHCIYPKGD